jgi:uncharacterized protein YukE
VYARSVTDPRDPYRMWWADGTSGTDAPHPPPAAQPPVARGGQQPGHAAPGSPAYPRAPVPGGAGGPPVSTSKRRLTWGGAVAALAVIVAVALIFSVRHGGGSAPAALSGHSGQSGSLSQPAHPAQPGQQSSGSGSASDELPASRSQLCQSVVLPLWQQFTMHFVQGMASPKGPTLQSLISDYREAVQRARSDPQVAQDLATVANGLQTYADEWSGDSPATAAALQSDWERTAQEIQALLDLCQ